MAVGGLSKLQQRFRAVPKAVRKAAEKALEKNATEIVAMMKRLVPVKSGALRDSIGWTWGDAPKGSMAIGTVSAEEGSDMRITIYAGTRDKRLGNKDAFYAVFQEFGTKKMAANPFFWPAIRANRQRARSRISREVRKAAREAFGG